MILLLLLHVLGVAGDHSTDPVRLRGQATGGPGGSTVIGRIEAGSKITVSVGPCFHGNEHGEYAGTSGHLSIESQGQKTGAHFVWEAEKLSTQLNVGCHSVRVTQPLPGGVRTYNACCNFNCIKGSKFLKPWNFSITATATEDGQCSGGITVHRTW